MSGYISLMSQELNILTVISIASLTDLNTKHSTIGARKVEQKERPKLQCVDFMFDRGLPASQVEPSVLSEVLASTPRLASREWIIFDDPQSFVRQSLSEGLALKSILPSGVFFPLIIVDVRSRIILVPSSFRKSSSDDVTFLFY